MLPLVLAGILNLKKKRYFLLSFVFCFNVILGSLFRVPKLLGNFCKKEVNPRRIKSYANKEYTSYVRLHKLYSIRNIYEFSRNPSEPSSYLRKQDPYHRVWKHYHTRHYWRRKFRRVYTSCATLALTLHITVWVLYDVQRIRSTFKIGFEVSSMLLSYKPTAIFD